MFTIAGGIILAVIILAMIPVALYILGGVLKVVFKMVGSLFGVFFSTKNMIYQFNSRSPVRVLPIKPIHITFGFVILGLLVWATSSMEWTR